MTNLFNIKPAEIAWLTALVGLLVYEAWAILTHHTTLSVAIWTIDRTKFGPIVPFLTGLLMGHFFFSGN